MLNNIEIWKQCTSNYIIDTLKLNIPKNNV